ncbi:MAG: HAMP domain-containing histidine kinase [Planctomycetes bacterium]|nr:HAMP domain-containing histidine kinase [Planctomycetota bacterium]
MSKIRTPRKPRTQPVGDEQTSDTSHVRKAPQTTNYAQSTHPPQISETSHLTETEQRLQGQFDRLEEQFEKLKDQTRQAHRLASLGTAATMLAHEFNNLMSPVVGYAQYALDSEDPELMVKALRITLKQTDIMTAMSDRILGLAINESAGMQRVNIAEAVSDARDCLIRDLAKDSIEMVVQIDEHLTFMGDPRQMQQVFFNLLTNARQAINHRHGRITISAEKVDDEFVAIRFSDNGTGISPDGLETVFEEFYSTKKNRPNKSGLGLGLALCREIVEEHRGKITASSKEGQGATFTITLPSGN